MQKVGDVCENCRERWEKRKKEPKVLQRIGSTEHRGMIVPACEYCDGPVIDIYRAQNHD